MYHASSLRTRRTKRAAQIQRREISHNVGMSSSASSLAPPTFLGHYNNNNNNNTICTLQVNSPNLNPPPCPATHTRSPPAQSSAPTHETSALSPQYSVPQHRPLSTPIPTTTAHAPSYNTSHKTDSHPYPPTAPYPASSRTPGSADTTCATSCPPP